MKPEFLYLFILLSVGACNNCSTTQKILPIPSYTASTAQLKQIERKYGMFIHFGMNTFHDLEWTDGTMSAESYNPTVIDANQWIETAKKAGMKYVILVSKHHDGFCLWDSKFTGYDVANSGNTTNVVEAVAKACQIFDIGFGLYYSLWDRNKNSNVKDSTLDAAYNSYMINQLNELMDISQKHSNVVELWLDGGWVKENDRWPIQEIYQTVKSRFPDCQIGVNWSIGLPENPDYHPVYPQDQKEGYPIRYFPSDFRLGDPYLPAKSDPKIFTHDGKEYYMPWESTVCISQRWFYNTTDTVYKSIDELAHLYEIATDQDNILILNSPPNRNGKIRSKDVELLTALKERLKI